MSLFLLLKIFCLANFTPSNEQEGKVYILFTTRESPQAYYRPFKNARKPMGCFHLEKSSGDCPSNDFFFEEDMFPNRIMQVRIDTLQNVRTSEWVSTQPDSILIRLFRNKDIYIIPKDSLKNNEGKAFLTTYLHCEIE